MLGYNTSFSPNSLLLGVLNSFLRCVRPFCHCWCPPFSAGHAALLFICLPCNFFPFFSAGHEAFLCICLAIQSRGAHVKDSHLSWRPPSVSLCLGSCLLLGSLCPPLLSPFVSLLVGQRQPLPCNPLHLSPSSAVLYMPPGSGLLCPPLVCNP